MNGHYSRLTPHPSSLIIHLITLLLLTQAGCIPNRNDVSADEVADEDQLADNGLKISYPDVPSTNLDVDVDVERTLLPPKCGDGQCSSSESCSTCPGDCGPCCPNGVCDNGEDRCNCPKDCELGCQGCCQDDECLSGMDDTACGSGGEECDVCLQEEHCDDGNCVPHCGQGGCQTEYGEDKCSCPEDCGGPCQGEDCAWTLECGSSCQTESCVQTCMSAAGQTAQEQYMAITECTADSCGQFQANAMKLQKCMYEACGDQWAECIGGWGTNGCMDVLNCAGTCGMDAGCQFDCLLAGDQSGLVDLFDLQACLQDKCSHCVDDQTCLQYCVMDKCDNEVTACQGA